MAMSRKDALALAITERNTSHLFTDRASFVQHACLTANFCASTNARFDFDRFLAEVGIKGDEYRVHGGITAKTCYPTTPLRVPRASRRVVCKNTVAGVAVG